MREQAMRAVATRHKPIVPPRASARKRRGGLLADVSQLEEQTPSGAMNAGSTPVVRFAADAGRIASGERELRP